MQRGDRLGQYEVLGKLGEGGMGEVYRARDTRLNRDVAVKVLPDLFARDPERLMRFTREAQALASLNHPNVAQIYGIVDVPPEGGSDKGESDKGGSDKGESDKGGSDKSGSHASGSYLVMELVDGEDLAQRLARGAIPVDDAIQIALQVAGGLEAAHERGIVHRDLKPGNIRLTSDGTAKILDFGLAKAMNDDAGAAADPLNSPTFTSPPTQMGVILGTAAYMAPEQARGRPVDKRADIWAFGCVVYEMLAAKRPFGGETVTDALAAIVKEDPAWSALPPQTPAALRELLRQCVVKDPKQRLRDVGDARIVLERLVSHAAPEPVIALPSPVARGRRNVVAIAVGVFAVAAAASVATWLLTRSVSPSPPPVARFVTPLPIDALPVRAGGAGIAFAPDGTSVVYAAQPALTSAPALFRRRLNSLEIDRIPNTEGATAPFFSPDGRWIGFFAGTAVMKVSVDGEGLAKICDRTRFSRASWGSGDVIVLGTSQIHSNGPLAKVAATGGTPTDLTALKADETAHQAPHFLPDGRHIVFSAIGPTRSELAAVPIGGGAHRLLGIEGSGASFVPPGHLLFARGRTLFTVPFDSRAARASGNPTQVLNDAGVFSGAAHVWIPMAAVDKAGSIAYLNKGGTLSIVRWIAPSSAPVPVTETDYRTPRLSPDGRRLVAAAGAAPSEIWVIDLDRGTRLLVTPNGGTAPIWSHDGRRIIYLAASGELMTVAADGSGTPEVLLPRQGSFSVAATAAAPDGSFFLVTAEDRGATSANRNRDVWIVRAGQKPVPVVATPADERGGELSRDSRWIAYSSSVSGREEIYVKSLAPNGRTIPVSTQGGTLPRWPRMDSLYFLGPRTLMRVPVRGDPLTVGVPVEAASIPQNMGGIDVHSDGRILIIEPKTAASGTRDALHVLLNWGPSLK